MAVTVRATERDDMRIVDEFPIALFSPIPEGRIAKRDSEAAITEYSFGRSDRFPEDVLVRHIVEKRPAICAATRLQRSALRRRTAPTSARTRRTHPQFRDLHAISGSFDIGKFNAFAEGVEEYVTQCNGMTGRDVSEDDLLEDGIRGRGASEGEHCGLEEMKGYYDYRGWVDGVDLDEKPDKLGIDIGPGPSVGADDGGAAAPIDD